jgi:hypothetical protein
MALAKNVSVMPLLSELILAVLTSHALRTRSMMNKIIRSVQQT